MTHTNFLRKTLLTSVALFSTAFADTPFGIIGGEIDYFTNGPAYAALISSSNAVTPLNPLTTSGAINSVAINALGQGLIGGQDFNTTQPAIAYLVSPTGILTPITTTLPSHGVIFSVAINASGEGIIGGENLSGGSFAYAAFVSPSGVALLINTDLPTSSLISHVAINDFGQGIIGGRSDTSTAYAAIVVSSSTTPMPISLPSNVTLHSVSINDSGEGIIGGVVSNAKYAAFVSPSGSATAFSLSPTSNSSISSVAINASGQGIVGGTDGINAAYAALVSSPDTVILITPLPSTGHSTIRSVAINSSNQGIIGGQTITGAIPYAALVSPLGVPTLISPLPVTGNILSVAINDFGQGIIGGGTISGANPYAAIVSPTGIATQLNLGLSNGIINSVALLPILTHIPTGSLSGNSLIFANYINEYAPQDAFYFAPAYFDGTLSEALESAAPTRNAISLYTASNNLFFLMTGLSNHLHNLFMQATDQNSMTVVGEPEEWQPEELMVSECLQKPKKRVEKCYCDEKNSNIWFEALGALAYQKEQHETPGFNPTTGGAILAYEGKTSDYSRVGAGATYLYTHVHEKQDAGHSNINQEDLFVYASWEKKTFYIDGSLLGGLFQISQVRNIHMTGFDFKSKSHPKGWQLLPHLEVGYKYMPYGTKDIALTFNPFVMVDWANAWQRSYKETGSGPFNAGQKSHYSSLLRSEVSLRVYETIFFDAWNLIFQEKAGYVNVHSFKTGNVNAFLVGSPGAFTVSTLTGNQNLGVAEFAMIFAPDNSNYPTGTIFYQGEFGSKYQSHQVAVELSWDF